MTKKLAINTLETMLGRKLNADLSNLSTMKETDPEAFEAFVIVNEIGRRMAAQGKS